MGDWAAKSSAAEELPKTSRKTVPRGSLLGSEALHRGGAVQNKPEDSTASEKLDNCSPNPAVLVQTKPENSSAKKLLDNTRARSTPAVQNSGKKLHARKKMDSGATRRA